MSDCINNHAMSAEHFNHEQQLRFAFVSWLNPLKNPVRKPRQSRRSLTCPRSQGIVTGQRVESQSASGPSSRVFLHLFSPCSQDGGLSCWAVPERSPLHAFAENNERYLRNGMHTFCIPLTTSFTKFVLLWFLCVFSLSWSLLMWIQAMREPVLPRKIQRMAQKVH